MRLFKRNSQTTNDGDDLTATGEVEYRQELFGIPASEMTKAFFGVAGLKRVDKSFSTLSAASGDGPGRDTSEDASLYSVPKDYKGSKRLPTIHDDETNKVSHSLSMPSQAGVEYTNSMLLAPTATQTDDIPDIQQSPSQSTVLSDISGLVRYLAFHRTKERGFEVLERDFNKYSDRGQRDEPEEEHIDESEEEHIDGDATIAQAKAAADEALKNAIISQLSMPTIDTPKTAAKPSALKRAFSFGSKKKKAAAEPVKVDPAELLKHLSKTQIEEILEKYKELSKKIDPNHVAIVKEIAVQASPYSEICIGTSDYQEPVFSDLTSVVTTHTAKSSKSVKSNKSVRMQEPAVTDDQESKISVKHQFVPVAVE